MAWGTSFNVYGPQTPFKTTIKKAYFATEPEYMEGKVWRLHLETDQPDPVEDDEAFTLKIGLGKGWTSDDGGNTVTHPEGKEQFDSRSTYGQWIDWAMEQPELFRALQDRGDPTQASVWEGVGLLMDVKTYTFNGEKRGMLFPSEFLGFDGEIDSSDEMSSEELNEELKRLAQANSTHTKFVVAASKLAAVKNDPDLKDQIAKKDYYEALKAE